MDRRHDARRPCRHLALADVLGVGIDLPCAPRIVFVSKHFCGDATDIALRFIAAQLPRLSDIHARVSVCIATCCHAKCSPSEYCNRPWVDQTLALSGYVWH
jgi:hypothetical protein